MLFWIMFFHWNSLYFEKIICVKLGMVFPKTFSRPLWYIIIIIIVLVHTLFVGVFKCFFLIIYNYTFFFHVIYSGKLSLLRIQVPSKYEMYKFALRQ